MRACVWQPLLPPRPAPIHAPLCPLPSPLLPSPLLLFPVLPHAGCPVPIFSMFKRYNHTERK